MVPIAALVQRYVISSGNSDLIEYLVPIILGHGVTLEGSRKADLIQ
jgi:hypothetical protein